MWSSIDWHTWTEIVLILSQTLSRQCVAEKKNKKHAWINLNSRLSIELVSRKIITFEKEDKLPKIAKVQDPTHKPDKAYHILSFSCFIQGKEAKIWNMHFQGLGFHIKHCCTPAYLNAEAGTMLIYRWSWCRFFLLRDHLG